MNKWIGGLVAAAGITLGGIILFKDKSVQSNIAGSQSGEAPDPAGIPAQSEETPTLSTEAGEGAELIKSRMKELFTYTGSRQGVIEKYGVLDTMFSGVEHKSGSNTVMNLLFGNVFKVPLYPKSLYPSYTAQLQTIGQTQGFEEITASSGDINTAFSIWKNALQLPDGQTFWYDGIEQLLLSGSFGKPGPADKNLSERYDAYTRDMQKIAGNLEGASRKLDDALRQQAIADLRGAGYKFTGV